MTFQIKLMANDPSSAICCEIVKQLLILLILFNVFSSLYFLRSQYISISILYLIRSLYTIFNTLSNHSKANKHYYLGQILFILLCTLRDYTALHTAKEHIAKIQTHNYFVSSFMPNIQESFVIVNTTYSLDQQHRLFIHLFSQHDSNIISMSQH